MPAKKEPPPAPPASHPIVQPLPAHPEEPRATTAEPAPEPRSSRRVVTVRLSSRPSGATVRNQEGGVLGQTPLALSLRTGSVARLTFTKHGYAPATRRVAVGSGSQTVVVELSRAAARRGRGRH